MTALAGAWRDFRDAARLFSRPARLYLGAEFLMWLLVTFAWPSHLESEVEQTKSREDDTA